MSLTGLFSRIGDIGRDIATYQANKEMCELDKEMDKYLEDTADIEVTEEDCNNVFKIINLQEKTGCDWGAAIDAVISVKKLTTGHFSALVKILSESGVTDKQQLFANMVGTIALGKEHEETTTLRNAKFSDTEILEFKDWLSLNVDAAKQMNLVFSGEAGEYTGEQWIPISPAVASAQPTQQPISPAPTQVQPQNPNMSMNFGPLVQQTAV